MQPNEAAELVLERMSMGYLSLDGRDVITYVNAEGERLLRMPREAALGRCLWDLFPGAQAMEFGKEYAAARRTGQERIFEAWGPIVKRWLEIRVVPSGQQLGIHLADVTVRHQANRRLKLLGEVSHALSAELEGGSEQALGRLARLLVPALGEWCIVTLVGPDGSLRDVGTAHVDTERQPVLERYASLRLDALREAAGRQESPLLIAARTGEPELLEEDAGRTVADLLAPGEARDLLLQLAPKCLLVLPLRARGRTVGLISLYDQVPWAIDRLETATEVADRAALSVDNIRAYAEAQAAQAVAESYASRMTLLGDVSELLSAFLDQGIAVRDLANLVVPELADWCIVSVSRANGVSRDLGWAHRDPSLDDALGGYARQQYDVMDPSSAVAVCLATGEPVIVPEMPPDLLDGWVADPAARAALGAMQPGSVAVMPLKSGDRTFGAMALVTLADRGPQSAPELATAREVARRAGLALEVSRLYAQQRQLAETLQRSLLTAPPEPPGMQVAVRYVPAAAEAQVGGDWYDAFQQPDGSLVLAIGDVIGHDTRAAAAMGQVRGLLRGIGYTTGAGPAALLTRLDEAMDGLAVGTTATAVVVRLLADRTLEWSNAGHPPALSVSSEGTVVSLGNADADLLLGIIPSTQREQAGLAMSAGDTLFLYTDGLVERRGTSLDEGLAILQGVLAELAAEPLETLCDQVLKQLLPPAAEDDVAIVALRLLPSSRVV